MSTLQHNPWPDRARRALSIVEMVVSIPLVGITLVAVLNLVGASRTTQFKADVGRQGHLLAQELMSEILQQDYVDPALALTVRDAILSVGDATYPRGPDNLSGSDEAATGDRSLFNDVDDYDGWSAGPPQARDGSEDASLAGWARSASVAFTTASGLTVPPTSDSGWKQITVTVTHDGVTAAELTALKTIGLPWLEACCFDDASCEHLRAEACVAQGGTAQGTGTQCATTDCPTGAKVLLVVSDDANPTALELDHQTLIESLGFAVTLIDDDASQEDYDVALADVDVVYASGTASSGSIGTKLTATTVGVLSSDIGLADELGIAETVGVKRDSQSISIIDNTHYVTSGFSLGTLQLYSYVPGIWTLNGTLAPGLQILGETQSAGDSFPPGLAVLETGAELYGGGFAAGRRLQVPWSEGGFDINALNADGQTIMKRAIEWAAGLDVLCGNGDCDATEECDCPADCGEPADFEQPGATCDDGMDNDCDDLTDCDDADCATEPACVPTVCGNGICESGEDCNSCPADCPSETGGKPSSRYCCGNGVVEAAEGDGSICDGNY